MLARYKIVFHMFNTMLNEEFFMRLCNSHGKAKKLMLHGTDVYRIMRSLNSQFNILQRYYVIYYCKLCVNSRRRLKDTDIPVLLAFLRTNPDVTLLNLAYNNIADVGFASLIEHIAVGCNL